MPDLTTITALVLDPRGVRKLELIRRPISPPAPDELQIAIRATGICGSDLHYYHNNRISDFSVLEPLSLGHESAGIVTALGGNISTSDFQVGDRVALEVGIPCFECDRCKEGRYNICKGMQFRSSARCVPHFQGTLQEKLNHPAAYCHKLPDSVNFEEGALVEPLSVGIHAVRRSGIGHDPNLRKACLVIGAGTIGLMTAAVLKTVGVQSIVMYDIQNRRLEFAREHDFCDEIVVLPNHRNEAQATNHAGLSEMAKQVYSQGVAEPRVETRQYDVVFECTGVESCAQTAIYETRPGGKVLLVGIGAAVQTIPLAAAAQREVDLIGVFRYASTYRDGIEMIAARNGCKDATDQRRQLPDLKKLITHQLLGLEKIADAFKIAEKGIDRDGRLVLKVIIEV